MTGLLQSEDRRRVGSGPGLIRGGTPAARVDATPDSSGRLACLHASLLCSRMPRAVICLTSAAYLAGLLDEAPGPTWVALPAPSHGARLDGVPHRLLRWSFPGAFEVGIANDLLEGVAVKRTDPVRTVVDLIRYARHVRSQYAGVRAGRRLVIRGGDPLEILEVARTTRAPAAALRTVEILVQALK